VTSAVGLASAPIAELVLTYMLMFTKGWPLLARQQQAHDYSRLIPGTLEDRTVGIVGMGSIGAEIARLARPFGCRIIGTRRSATRRTSDPTTGDEVVPASDLHYLLGASDFVVLAAPLTPETRGLIDARALAAMRPDAVLMNIARGELIDDAALLDALRQRRIRGAALDVFAEEPLPPDSPLWDLDNVILTPHIAGGFDRYFEVGTAMFCANLERYLRGEPLENVIEAARGY
jgi:phosphoglycerate dehydrogenase-like enzyme